MTRRRRKPRSAAANETFWGSPTAERVAAKPIRPTSQPAALLQSLGPPPLVPQAVAQHTLTEVYTEAVIMARALAAANGLLDDDDSQVSHERS